MMSSLGTVEMDPKIAAIMAKLSQGEEKKKKEEAKPKEETVKPPTTLDEFMLAEKLEEWPQRLTSEGPMDIQGEGLLLGSKEDIADLLREAAPLGLNKLEEMEARLERLEDSLNYYASQILTEDRRQSRLQDGLFYSPSRTFITEISESDAVRSHHSSKGHRSLIRWVVESANARIKRFKFLEKVLPTNQIPFIGDFVRIVCAISNKYFPPLTKSTREEEESALAKHMKQLSLEDFVDSLMETRKKSIEYCQFPGFRHGELIELPGQLESPPILHRVTKAQDFNPGFRKYWKKLFLSEASVSVMQDSFWWFFLDRFDKTKSIDKNLLYDRIADSYVALFTSINEDVKDKFLMSYPDCLSQAIFSAYWEAFPESRNKLDDNFRQVLINTICEWTTGLKPVPGSWKNWKVKRLQFKPVKGLEKETSKTAEQMMHAAAMNKELNYSLDIESFEKLVERLGTEHVSYGITPLGMQARELTKMTNTSSQGPTTVSVSRLATAGTDHRKVRESHQIGPGPAYERVKFNTQGRSPLISHYLHLRQLKDFHQPGKQVRRTEIVKLPSPGPTYKHLIHNTLQLSDALSKEYQKICDQTDQEILELEKRQRDTNREFNNLTKELMFTKNPVDLRILSDKIIGLRKSTGALKDKDRETPLLKDEKKGGDTEEISDTDDNLSN